MYFFVIIWLFIFAFGVSTQALMYPNQTLSITVLKNVFFPAFFVLGGDFYTSDLIMSGNFDFNSANLAFILSEKNPLQFYA